MAFIQKTKDDGKVKNRIVVDMRRSGGNSRSQVPERLVLPRVTDVSWSRPDDCGLQTASSSRWPRQRAGLQKRMSRWETGRWWGQICKTPFATCRSCCRRSAIASARGSPRRSSSCTRPSSLDSKQPRSSWRGSLRWSPASCRACLQKERVASRPTWMIHGSCWRGRCSAEIATSPWYCNPCMPWGSTWRITREREAAGSHGLEWCSSWT